MPGAPRHLRARDFVIVDLDAVEALGGSWVAAGLFQRIAWRSKHEGYWTATLQELAGELRVSVSTVRRAVERLREVGWIAAERAQRWAATLTWRPVWAGDDGVNVNTSVEVNVNTSSSQTGDRTTTPSDAAASRPAGSSLPESSTRSTAAEEEPVTTARDREPVDADLVLEGMPEPLARKVEPSAGELVKAWCRGWSEAHQGEQPHKALVRRVAGICKNLARDCDSLDSWGDAWRAALAAGRSGRFDVVSQLAAPAPLGKGNHYLELAKNPEQLASSGLLGHMLSRPVEGTPALGSAS